jgi:ABC-type glycerol-3-phosphate transport system substrate-binding protein
VQTLVGLLKSGVIGSDFQGGASAVSGEQGFPKGQYAMYIDGPWAVPTYSSIKGMPNYGIATFPQGQGGSVSTVGGEDTVVSSHGHNQAAADKFAEFLFTTQLLTARIRANSPGYSQMDSDWSNELQQILAGKVSVTAGLNAVAQQANSDLAGS